MNRTNPFDQLTDRDSPLVQDALTRPCEVCKVKPGKFCQNIIVVDGDPLPGRVVHFARCTP